MRETTMMTMIRISMIMEISNYRIGSSQVIDPYLLMQVRNSLVLRGFPASWSEKGLKCAPTGFSVYNCIVSEICSFASLRLKSDTVLEKTSCSLPGSSESQYNSKTHTTTQEVQSESTCEVSSPPR